MNLLEGKNVLIVGLANKHSIAYGIAKAMYKQGANLCFSYQNDRFKSKVENLAKEFDTNLIFPCCLSSDNEINTLIESITKHWAKIDIIVHSAAFAPSESLREDYLDNISRDSFSIAHDISSYSLTALCKASIKHLSNDASILSISNYGAQKAFTGYNVMGPAKASLEASIRYLALSLGKNGIRVNGISAGPIKTLAASGIKGFKNLLHLCEKSSPLRRNVTTEEVGNAAMFLCSNLASGITGEILYVDAGFNTCITTNISEY